MNCQTCNEPIEENAEVSDDQGNIFCSMNCRKVYISQCYPCENCGEPVHEDNKIENEDNEKFCSEECAQKAEQNDKIKEGK